MSQQGDALVRHVKDKVVILQTRAAELRREPFTHIQVAIKGNAYTRIMTVHDDEEEQDIHRFDSHDRQTS